MHSLDISNFIHKYSGLQKCHPFFLSSKEAKEVAVLKDFTMGQGWVSSGRNRFLPDIRKKLEERGFFHFLPFLPEETWKKVEETPKCQLGTIIKFAVKGFLCILIQ